MCRLVGRGRPNKNTRTRPIAAHLQQTRGVIMAETSYHHRPLDSHRYARSACSRHHHHRDDNMLGVSMPTGGRSADDYLFGLIGQSPSTALTVQLQVVRATAAKQHPTMMMMTAPRRFLLVNLAHVHMGRRSADCDWHRRRTTAN